MKKHDFILELKERLSGLPQSEIEERLLFYSEMIDDRMEEGLTEEEAVAEIGGAEEIAQQIIFETPLAKLAKERIKPSRKLRAWELLLLILGSPLWLSLLIAVSAVLISLYISLWAIIISLWSVFIALCGAAVGLLFGGIFFLCNGNVLSGIACLGVALVCAGIAIFTFFGCKAATKSTIHLSKRIGPWAKKLFIMKGANEQ